MKRLLNLCRTPDPLGFGGRQYHENRAQQDPQALLRPAGACSERAAACCLPRSVGWLGKGSEQILPESSGPEKRTTIV